MADTYTVAQRIRARPILAGTVLVFVAVVATVLYVTFFQIRYAPVFTHVRPSDAAPIIAELDRRHISYRLADDGTTILVSDREADEARIALAGSDAAERGAVGFELFNKSDMGLTNFAQKINYQRALQGELARTIETIRWVDGVRVHLALPEQALFRGDKNRPKAAITVTMKQGHSMTAAMVDGLRELVAAAVPDLSTAEVVVLDADGRVVSPGPVAVDASQLSEQSAAEQYYRARAQAAAGAALPGQTLSVQVTSLGPREVAMIPGKEGIPTGEMPANRNFRLRVELRTSSILSAEDQRLAADAVRAALALDPASGDLLVFRSGAAEPAPPWVTRPAPAAAADDEPLMPPSPQSMRADWAALVWIAVGVLAALLVGVALLRGRTNRARLADQDHDAFAERLRQQLVADRGGS